MLNQAIIVGKLVEEPTIEKLSDEISKGRMLLSVQRTFKNESGEYETDYIPCMINGNMILNVVDYCHKNDILGVKGRISSEAVDGENDYRIAIVAEKVTFLSSKKDEEE